MKNTKEEKKEETLDTKVSKKESTKKEEPTIKDEKVKEEKNKVKEEKTALKKEEKVEKIENIKEEKKDEKKHIDKKELIMKLILFFLVIGYLIYFIYEYLNVGFDFSTKANLFKLTLLFISIFLLCLVSVTNKTAALFFSIINYILILFLIGLDLITLIPKPKEEEKPKEEPEEKEELVELVCTGRTDISSDTIIEVNYTGDVVNKIIYTYTFEGDELEVIEKEKDNFDKTYENINGISSGTSISDKGILTFTFDMDEIDKDKLPEDKKYLQSFKELNEKDLANLDCQS